MMMMIQPTEQSVYICMYVSWAFKISALVRELCSLWFHLTIYLYVYLYTQSHTFPCIGLYTARNIAILDYYLSLKCDPMFFMAFHCKEWKKQKWNNFGTRLQKHLRTTRKRNKQTNGEYNTFHSKYVYEATKNQWSSLLSPIRPYT